MANNSAAHEKKVKYAVQVLLKNPRLKVHQAMLVALFGKKDLDDDNIRRVISRRRNLFVKALIPPGIVQCGSPLSLTDLLATDNVTESTARHPATHITADVVPPPTRKKQMMTALACKRNKWRI